MSARPEPTEQRVRVLTRLLDAPRSLVFRVWTEPGHMAQWWGPRTMTTPVCELNVRPGGAYRIVMRSPDGTEHPMCGVFREVVAPERLVLTMDVSGHPDEWHDLINPTRYKSRKPVVELLQTITFETAGGKTKLPVRTRFESAALRDARLQMGMTEGWSESLDKLAELLPKTPTPRTP